MTVEAVTVLPMVLLLMYLACRIFLFMLLELSVIKAGVEACTSFSGLGYGLRRNGGEEIDTAALLFIPVSEAFLLPIRNRKEVDKLQLFTKQTKENGIELKISYEFVFCYPFAYGRIPVEQTCYFYPNFGTYDKDRLKEAETTEETGNTQETVVYVTSTGTHYHRKRTCSYIYAKPYGLLFSKVNGQRNRSGEKYRACTLCISEDAPKDTDTVYLTAEGNRYHGKLQCSAIYKSVQEKKLSQVGELPACTKCGQAEMTLEENT